MRSTPAASVLGFLYFGLICDVQKVHSQPNVIKRRAAEEVTTLQEDVQKVIDQIHSLSRGGAADEQMRGFPNSGETFSLHSYYDMLRNLLELTQPLLRERFMEELPGMLVCILSGEQDCGLKAELTKTVSVELVEPLLKLLASPTPQTCTRSQGGGGADSVSFRSGEAEPTALDGFLQSVLNVLRSLPLSGHVKDTLSSLMDTAVKNLLTFAVPLLQTPMEYINIALQFGIRVPSLDDKDTCEQGDLKQLIMWGINHNVSWSFAPSLVDVLLELFLEQDEPVCGAGAPDCQTPPLKPDQRSLPEATRDSHDVFLKCDRHNLAQLNDTVCADILQGSGAGSSAAVLTLCRALGSLSPNQLEQVWSNMCYVVQTLVSPVVGGSSHCSDGEVTDSTTTTAAPGQSAPRRAAREAANLRLLACNYDVWTESQPVDNQFVSLCSDNDREEFVKRVCTNAAYMKSLLSDQNNHWLYAYCANSSADRHYLVSHFCVYQEWLDEPTGRVSTALLEFCMNLDGPRMSSLMCQHMQLLMFVLTEPENIHLMPNCTDMPPLPPGPNVGLLGLESCRYSQWLDLTQITTDDLVHCTDLDRAGFTLEVCRNTTFIDSLLQNEEHGWLREFCNASLASLFPEPSQSVNTAQWCDYDTWAGRQVDVSVVALCWQNDKRTFQSKVCCQTSLMEKLLQDPQNQWLLSSCTDMEDLHTLLKVCKYSDWSKPIIVDMTELALCAELDQRNFTSKVCTNETILQNLLANQDNTWLVQYCANHSKPDTSPSGDGEGGGDPAGFNPAEQCQYSSWTISLPGVALLTLCWENDQSKFISSICPNTALLLKLYQESYSAWVSSMCAAFANYTSETTTPSTNTNSPTPEPKSCLARNLVKQFHLSCSIDFTVACQPGISQNLVLKMMVHCWVESLEARVEELLTPPVAAVLEQALSTTVVFLLAVEEVQASPLHITKNINYSVLKSVAQYLEKEKNFENKRVLLQCFGTVITSLMQVPRDMTRKELSIVKEYFIIPMSSLTSVLSAADVNTVRQILRYYSRHRDTLQLSDEYLSTMMSVLLRTHVVKHESFFPELAPLLASADPTDILALPPLQDDNIVLNAINTNLEHMTLEQREAFGSWYSQAMPPSKIIEGHESLIPDTGDLIAYLPFHSFQHLSPAQLMNGLDLLLRNNLTSLKQEFIVHNLIGKMLTTQDIIRLGKLLCLADPKDLLLYKYTEAFTVIQDIVMDCTRDDELILPNHLISSVLLHRPEFQFPSVLSADRLAEIAHLLPLLGISFLQKLAPSQLLDALPALSKVSFSPAQASVILDKLSNEITLTDPDSLRQLGSLIVGMQAETLLTLTDDRLLSSLPAIAQHLQGLSPPQVNAVATKLWGFVDDLVVIWLGNHQLDSLLYCTPLISVMPKIPALVNNTENITTHLYNTQQAKAIFKEALKRRPNLINQQFLSLGTLGQGVSCKFLNERFPGNISQNEVSEILQFLRQQPRPLHAALKTCLIKELYQLKFFPRLLKDLGAELAVFMSMSRITKFSTHDMYVLRTTILQDPRHFLLLHRTKQALMVDKMVQKMGMYTGVFTPEEFRSLGVMAPFVLDEVFIQLDRSFFVDNLSSLLGLCYTQSKMNLIALILQEPAVFGPVESWNHATLIQVDRFLFFLPDSELQKINPALMTLAHIEKLFISQRRWERGDVGASCLKSQERKDLFQRQQFVLQYFMGFVRINQGSSGDMVVPSCDILYSIPPAAWPPSSLTSMPSWAFSDCLELMGHDPFFQPYKRRQVFDKVKQMYGPVSAFSPSLIAELGDLAVEMSEVELSSLRLVERRSIAALGAISQWTDTQLAVLFTTVLSSTKRSTPSQLDSSTLVAMGYIVCGATVDDMDLFNALEFSKAVLFLGQLRLPCSKEQLNVLVGLLSHTLTFGHRSTWGTDVFIEIGVLAAGLPDLDMSSLVKEQIEGITPMAISMIPPESFRVTLDHKQIGMFSYDQAAAVTDEQISVLSEVQRTALFMALTPWENRPVDFRGRSRGLPLRYSPLCLTLGLLMLLTVLSGPDVP